jgi:hypothetical protein
MGDYRDHRLKVLIVDDNRHMRAMVDSILQIVGVRTTFEASRRDDAWWLFPSRPCDVMFAGWVMEGMLAPGSAKLILDRLSALIEPPRSLVRAKAYFALSRRRRRNHDSFEGAERRTSESNSIRPGEPSANPV